MMGRGWQLVAVCLILPLECARAEVHDILVANRLSPASIHHVQFDDAEPSLRLVKSMPAEAGHIWISLSPDKKTLYAASKEAGSIVSYGIEESGNVSMTSVVPVLGHCLNQTPAFVVATEMFAFTAVYPGPDACGVSISVGDDGSLGETLDTWVYGRDSGVHGLALSEANGQAVLWSADLTGGALWSNIIREDGMVGDGQRYPLGTEAMLHPRHVAVHPSQSRAFVVMETEMSFQSFTLDREAVGIRASGAEILLVPEGSSPSEYTAADIAVSDSGQYLWATSRARGEGAITGYLSGFLLDPTSGAVLKRLFMYPLGSFGSISNAVTPAPWSDEYALVTDVPGGYVEVWQMQDPAATDLGLEYSGVRSVARLDISFGACCANAVWLN